MKPANIGIFIPHLGCPNQCSFCNQKKIAGRLTPPTADEVFDILTEAAEQLGERKANTEIAFFGGSFTAIDSDYMLELLETAGRFLGDGGFKGIRISTRPDYIDNHILSILKRYGVTAIELGAQSMDGEVLRLNRRGHTPEQVEESSRLIKQYGFELGLQMMVGLLGDSRSKLQRTAERIADLGCETVRIYPTIVVRDTYLEQLYNLGEYTPLTLEQAVDICKDLLLFFESRGIKVIRLGLHADSSLIDSVVAGPFHPAFRELCESRIFYDSFIKKLAFMPKGRYNIYVNPVYLSKAIGNKRDNILKLKNQGYDCKILTDSNMRQFDFKVEEVK